MTLHDTIVIVGILVQLTITLVAVSWKFGREKADVDTIETRLAAIERTTMRNVSDIRELIAANAEHKGFRKALQSMHEEEP